MKSTRGLVTIFLFAECIFLATSASLNGTGPSSASAENVDSPSATEVVFDDSASEVSNDNLEATTVQPLSERLEEADGNVYQTTSIPCTNDIEGPACPSDAVAGDTVPLSATLITSNDASADEEKGTTVQP
ncbi:uncharacterized protein LOC110851676 [Folsomia candida]|uniref:uncharacterized protein LOC110851676 n=1 Tax=Folsomia candida TaxID=158441 RepID=UPI000B9066EB|nr:uncharacterized protein LOC110851676 [Folsomia candida]